ncbi:Slg1p [Saccharomyces cerevisiae YJM1248]|nr:Slg1p [Saccharomyces cerevisiae YJM1248]AJU07134.1 Slg1p [Saccharomyces cerevisiae YJM1439]
MRPNKTSLLLALLSILSQANAYEYVNCFSSLPSDFSKADSYNWQSSSHCNSECSAKGASYFALYNHSECYCGDTNPSGSESTSSSCNTYCFGYSSEMCGGEDAYSVYQLDSDTNSNSISSSDSSTESTSASSSTTSPTTSSTTSTTSSMASSSTVQNSPESTQAAASISTSQSSSTVTSESSLTSDTLATSSTSSQSQDATSIIYSTTFHTEGGSTIFVTNTITASAQNSGSATGTAGSDSTSGSKTHKKKANVGAIVGGVVGGVVGAVAIALCILLIVRHINMKREQDRMEKEYQEAIKPVEYPDKLYASSFSSNHGPSSGSFEEEHTKGQTDINPFDDSRRISNGTFINGGPGGKNNVLTVVNPDEAD